MTRRLPLLMVMGAILSCACGDGRNSGPQSESEDCLDTLPDSDFEAITDARHEILETTNDCFFERISYHYLIEGTDLSDAQEFWLVFMPGGYLIGRNTRGSGASADCYQIFWDLLDCNTDSALVKINGGCERDGLPERLLEFSVGDVDDIGLPTVLVEQLELTISTFAIPSEIDAICQTWVCDELLPPFPTGSDGFR